MLPDLLSHIFVQRLLITLALLATGVGLYALLNRLLLRRARPLGAALPHARSGAPILLYFTTPDCQPCKTVQRPAIQRVLAQVGGHLQCVEVDASKDVVLARRWGVLSVPTTFLIDARGIPRHVNHGLVPEKKLLAQIQDII